MPILTDNPAWWAMLLRVGVYLGKVVLFLFLYMWIRWTLPRFRYDQLMRLAWCGLVPIGLALTALAIALVYVNESDTIWLALPGNVLILAIVLGLASRSRVPITGRQASLPAVETGAA